MSSYRKKLRLLLAKRLINKKESEKTESLLVLLWLENILLKMFCWVFSVIQCKSIFYQQIDFSSVSIYQEMKAVQNAEVILHNGKYGEMIKSNILIVDGSITLDVTDSSLTLCSVPYIVNIMSSLKKSAALSLKLV